MKKKVCVICNVILILFSITVLYAQQKDLHDIDSPYLGQKPPGIYPEIFVPEIISTGMSESTIAVAPDGKEIFYTVHAGNSETIVTTRMENGCWTTPEVAFFSGKYLDGFPAMNPDGSKLFFHSYRPLDSDSLIADVVNIWFIEKIGSEWTEPKPIGPPINGDGFVCCPSVTETGTLYYSKKTKDGGEKIYRSRFVNGKYLEPEALPQQVNREKEQFHAVISPDESYLILPRENYFVSFRDEHDRWSDLIKLGDNINSMISGWCPSISSDGKFFSLPPILKCHGTSILKSAILIMICRILLLKIPLLKKPIFSGWMQESLIRCGKRQFIPVSHMIDFMMRF